MTTGLKRSRKHDAANGLQPAKKAKVDSKADSEAEILELESSIAESRKNFNNIVKLLHFMRDEKTDLSVNVLAAVSASRAFCRLISAGNLASAKHAPEKEKTVASWLNERLREFEDLLCTCLTHHDDTKSTTALTLLMRLTKESAKLEHSVPDLEQRFAQVVECIAAAPLGSPVLHHFVEEFANKYGDIRLRFFRLISDVLSTGTGMQLDTVIGLLISIEPVGNAETDQEIWFSGTAGSKAARKRASVQGQQKQAQKAWMAVFQRPKSQAQRKRILEAVSSHVAPWFIDIELLMDFLTDSFNVGGSTSLAALSGIFFLIQNRNLDYPQFYTKLYSMLDADVLHSKHRSRFFRLLETFLNSTHLPAALVASFVKRLARRSLSASPPAIVVVVPFIYNLLQGHPACTHMIHRTTELKGKNEQDWGDPFDDNESDPMSTHALESSLWEIQNLQSHYHPNVATIAKIISDPFTKASYNLEDFLDHSYATMLDAELSKDLKKVPEIEYQIPKKVFFKDEAASDKSDNLVVRLWDFS